MIGTFMKSDFEYLYYYLRQLLTVTTLKLIASMTLKIKFLNP